MSEMKLIPIVHKPIIRLPSLSQVTALPRLSLEFINDWTVPQKVLLVSVAAGFTFVGLTARYLRRRRRTTPKSSLSKSDPHRQRKTKPITICSPSGEIHTLGQASVSPGFHRMVHRQSSFTVSSEKNSSITVQSAEDNCTSLTPQQFGLMGMEALETAISLWEDALASYTSVSSNGNTALTSQEEAEFTSLLQRVIDEAYTLQDQCEHLFLHQHSVLFRSSSATPVPSECAGEPSFDRRTLTSISSIDSFVSCQGDIADLADFEEFEEIANHPLYLAALKYHEDHNITYRDVRTEWVQCSSDLEYICKVHCIRYACHSIFSQDIHRNWFIEAGREIITSLLTSAHKDPKDAIIAYDELLEFLSTCDWSLVEAELSLRGVTALTFYDIVLDFILMDAFEDLENPPSSVLAVVQNRWLSNGFKESALSTAVWSVVKAKRRLLKYQDGFLSHFYDISEHISPLLAWGFLGPNQSLQDLCFFFKDQIQGLLQDMFNFNTVRYTNIEELSTDILSLTHERYDCISQRFAL